MFLWHPFMTQWPHDMTSNIIYCISVCMSAFETHWHEVFMSWIKCSFRSEKTTTRNQLYVVVENQTLFIKFLQWKHLSIFDKSIKWEPVGCNDILRGDHYHNQELSFISHDGPRSGLSSPPSSLRQPDQNCTSMIFPPYSGFS